MNSKPVFVVMGLWLAIGLLSATAKAQYKDNGSFRGVYSNYDYAFTVRPPNALIGYSSQPPNPNHGCGIQLDDTGQAYMWADGSYNAAEWESLAEAVDVNIEYLKNNSLAPVVELVRKKTKMAGLPAVRSVARYKDKNGTAMVQEIVMAMRKNRTEHDVEIVYTIGLRTPEMRIQKDRVFFNKLRRSFTLLPLP
jgi:hypothetical protein